MATALDYFKAKQEATISPRGLHELRQGNPTIRTGVQQGFQHWMDD